jgi:hypothetical protein
MAINEFISDILDELQDLKSNANKKRYKVEELEFELSFVAQKTGEVKTSKAWDILLPVTVGGKYSRDEIQKVKIKLKPRLSVRDSSVKEREK